MPTQDASAGATKEGATLPCSARLAKLPSRCSPNADCEQDVGLKAGMPTVGHGELHSPSTARTGMRDWSPEKSVRFLSEEHVKILRHEATRQNFGKILPRLNANADYTQDARSVSNDAAAATPTKQRPPEQSRRDRASQSGVRSGRFSCEEQATFIARLERYEP